MRVTLVLVLVLAMGSVSAQLTQPYVIGPHRIGPVTVGDAAQAVYQSVPRHELVNIGDEVFLAPALRLTLPGLSQPGGVVAELRAKDSQLVVYRIAIDDPTLRTARGIGVGSTVDELRRVYEVSVVGIRTEGFYVRVDELSADFLLDAGSSSWREPSSVPGVVKVLRILLVE